MSAYCESCDLSGFANFFQSSSKRRETALDAMKIYDYVFQKGGRVVLGSIDEPKKEYENMVDVFETGLAHEQQVTSKIYALTDIATEERGHCYNQFFL